MKKIIYRVIFLLLLISLFNNCTSDTEVRVDKANKLLDNGKYLVVEKINKRTQHKGIITNHNYGTTHNYTYKFTIDRGNVSWDGGSGEPKHLLFCNDTTYVHYLKEKYVAVKNKDTLNGHIKNEGYYSVQEIFEVYVDERYFFKLFGDDYWVEILPETYTLKKTSCAEYDIPNDNELSLIVPIEKN